MSSEVLMAGSTSERFDVQMFRTARMDMPTHWVYYQGGMGWSPIAYYAVMARNSEHAVLIGGDFQPDDSVISDIWRDLGEQYAGAEGRTRMSLQREPQNLLAQLAEADIVPEDVTHVVLSPLLCFATGTLSLFPNAELLVGRQGWEEFWVPERPADDPRPHRYHRPPLPRDCVVPRPQVEYLLDHWDRLRMLDDEDTVCDGITTFFAGVHHRSTLAVRVESTAGVVIWTDAAWHDANIADDIALGVPEDLREARDAYARIRREADIALAAHDPGHLGRFPGGRIVAVTSS